MKKSTSGRVLLIDERRIYLARGRFLFQSDNYGVSWREIAELPVSLQGRVFSSTSLARRLFRFSVHHLVRLNGGLLLVFFGRQILLVEEESGSILNSVELVGGRPLLVGFDGQTTAYGRYTSNEDRRPVPVMASFDGGKVWEKTFEFQKVRHVHGIFYDDFTKTWWATTGDDEGECGIWQGGQEPTDFRLVLGGGQQYRAVQLLFTRDRIFYGSDSPLERNFIYSIDRNGCDLEQHAEVEGSVFYGSATNRHLYFSTAVEPSAVNKQRSAVIWRSDRTGSLWGRHSEYRKDLFPMKLFQYGQIFFPRSDNSISDVWVSHMATEFDDMSNIVE